MNLFDPPVLLGLMCAFVVLPALFDAALEILNLRAFPEKVPGELAAYYGAETHQRSRDYHRATTSLSLFEAGFMCLVTVLVLASGVPGRLDALLSGWGLQSPWISLVFFASLGLASSILGLPFRMYRIFVVEEKFGFNRSTPRVFVLDQLKSLVLGGLVGTVLLLAFIALVGWLGQGFWLWFLLVALGFSLLMNLFYTSLILPLFNKLKALEEGELKTAIEDYARKVGFPLDSILVMDGSKRSSKANAFFSGLGRRKRIILFDTLIETHSVPELVAVLAHEVGHWKKHHQITGFLASAIQMALLLWIFSLVLLLPGLSAALGGTAWALHLNLTAFALLIGPVSGLSGLLFLLSSRRHEFQADAFASQTASGDDLARALARLSEHNLGNPEPHPAFVFFNYTHPPVVMRLRALEKLKQGDSNA